MHFKFFRKKEEVSNTFDSFLNQDSGVPIIMFIFYFTIFSRVTNSTLQALNPREFESSLADLI